MRILICGLGSVGRRHLRNLVSLGQEDLVLYRTGKSRLPGDELEGWPVSNRLEAALKDWAPDAAVIANPTSLHLETAQAAAETGCHILLEKPISDRLVGLAEFETSVARGGARVLVGYQFRFHPGLRAAKAILDGGSIGRPVSARAVWGEYLPGWHPWEDYRQAYSARADLGGGAVLTLSHPFDYLRWLFGEVDSVSAQVGKGGQLEIDVDDVAEVILSFDSGLLASVHLDYYRRPADHWLEVTGTQGGLRWDNSTGETTWWSEAEPDGTTLAPPGDFERNTLFVDEIRHFLDVVDGRAQPQCTLDDGAQALKVALAALASSREGRRIEMDTL